MKYSVKDISDIIGAQSNVPNDGTVSHILIDSRRLSFPETTLFFAIKTATNDGHKYVGELYNLGVRNFVISNNSADFAKLGDANFLIVEDTVSALQKLAAYHRERFNIPVIGITGSNGKTIVKELLYQLLRDDYNIVRSPRSYNSQIGVPLSVREMNENHTLAIFEAGISKPGEMQKLQNIIKPTIGVITNIGEAHQENFKSAKEKCLEKISLFIDSNVIIHNADNKLICETIDEMHLSHKTFGWSCKNKEAKLYVETLKSASSTILHCTMSGKKYDFTIPFTDDAFIEDTINCAAVLFYLLNENIGKKTETFANLETVAMRLETKEGINGCQLINDTYNSDINSLDIALDFQLNRRADKNLKSTIILSDILQSGMSPEQLYKRVAELLRRKKINRFIGIGTDIKSQSINFFGMDSSFYSTTEEFIGNYKPEMFYDEIILLKGSRSFHFEKITSLLEKKVHQTVLEVNLDAIIHNFNYYRSLLKPTTKMVCMVKAFGYGVGSLELAKTLQEHRCDYLAVAVADEGEYLRNEGITTSIMVMNPEIHSFNLLFEYMLEPEVYSFRLLDALIKEAEKRGITAFPIHIKVDTGMHRLGFEPSEIPEVARRIKAQNALVVRSVFSHLAGSDSTDFDDFTKRQLNIYTAAAKELESNLGYNVIKHICNSAGIERFTEYQNDMVRLGISLYGISASGTAAKDLQCVCSLKTVILQIRNVPKGDSIGYSRKTVVNRDSRIAIIPIGYADGLDRHLSNGVGEVLIAGKRCKIVGNICMDACMVDVTDTNAQEGDEAIIFNEELTVSEIADKLGTIPYEILTSVSPRVKRVYYRE